MKTACYRGRVHIYSHCLYFRRITDISDLGRFDRAALAHKVFGPAVERELKRVSDTLMTWGYASRIAQNRERTCLCEAHVLNGSPRLEDLSFELIAKLHATSTKPERRHSFQRISKGLCSMGILDQPIQHGFDKARGGAALNVRAGISEDWLSFASRWRSISMSSPNSRSTGYYLILKTGRWVTETYPQLASPERWTRETAVSIVAAACRMRIGDWSIHVNHPSDKGKPLTPSAIRRMHDCNSSVLP